MIITDEVKRIIENIRDNTLDVEDVSNALQTPDIIWNSSRTIQEVGGANLNLLQYVREEVLPVAKKEFPEFFERSNDGSNNAVQ